MCTATAAMAAVAAVGAGISYAGQRKQSKEVARARAAQEKADNARKAISLMMRNENENFAKRRNEAIVQEAAEVAPMAKRPEILQQAEDDRTQSNINAMQAANALGEEAVQHGAEGNHSDAYIQKRAKMAAAQTERALKIARLFGRQDATGDALLLQNSNALNPRLNQGAIAAQRDSMNRGYGWAAEDVAARGARDSVVDTSKGAGLNALGGLAMNVGMQGLGSGLGEAGGWGAIFGNKPVVKSKLY